MLRRLGKLIDLTIEASDGEIGSIRDIYFDDHHWSVRYLVVEADMARLRRQVLIAPTCVEGIHRDRVRVDLSRQQIEASPPVEMDKPVSRQREPALFDLYGYPYYWGGPSRWGVTPNPVNRALSTPHAFGSLPEDFWLAMPEDPRLRSCKEVIGYRLLATDDSIGHLDDFLFDAESWAICYIVVSARKGSREGHLVISPEWIENVSWEQKTVFASFSRHAVQDAPQYDPRLNHAAVSDARPHQRDTRPH